jgi:hypothetical protein
MKTISILAALLAAASLAAPAQAHVGARPHRHPHGAAGWKPVRAEIVRDGINNLEADINRADNNDTISEREAADLRARLSSLRSEFQNLNRNGLTRGEVTTLESRTNYIRSRLNMERVDWDGHAG